MKYQEKDSQNEKLRSSERDTEEFLTREEGTALCRRIDEREKRFRAYMRMREAQKAEEEARKAESGKI